MVPLFALADSAPLLRWFTQQLWNRPMALIFFGAVLLYVCYYILRAERETRACRTWITRRSVERRSEVVAQLVLFTDEAERWRSQGIAVPMTDYSDRVDSVIQGAVDNLHSAVNLFLIVGLAGTFLGMAEFGRQAPSLQQEGDPRLVLDALRLALGHSFPIGFLGLCLTVVGHPIAALVDGRLRRAAKDAVNCALRLRTAAVRQTGSEALLAEVRNLPENLARILAASQLALAERFEPLLHIPEAILKANEDSTGPMRDLFTESRKEWKETVVKLNTQNKRMADAVERLEQPITNLTGKVDEISRLVVSAQSVVSRVLADAEKVSAMMETVQQRIHATAESLNRSAERLHAVPDSVQQDLYQLNRAVTGAIQAYYESLGRAYVDSVRQLAVAASGDITTAAQTASGELTAAACSLRVAADAITPELQAAIRLGADHLGQHLSAFDAAFRQHFPQAVRDLQGCLHSSSKQIEASTRVLEGMANSSNVAASSADAWRQLQVAINADTDALRVIREEMEKTAGTVQLSAEAHSKVPPAVERSVAALQLAVDALRKPLERISTGAVRKSSLWQRIFGGRTANDGA